MLLLGSAACNAVPVTALGDPTKVKEGSERVVLMPNGQKVKAICLNGEWVLGSQALKFTADTLPNPAILSPGVPVSVTTPYGENVATVVNGTFRYLLPFRTTWAGRPPVSAVPVGTELQVTDFNNQKWVSDGVEWRPAQGRVLLFQKAADGNAALSTLSGITSGEFAVVKPVIKAGMIPTNSKLRFEGMVTKAGTAGTFVPAIYLGKTNSMATDPAVGSVGVTITVDGSGTRWDMLACFGVSPSAFLRSGNTAPQGQSAGNVYSQGTNVDTAVDMFVTLGVVNGNTADTYALKSYSVWLEA